MHAFLPAIGFNCINRKSRLEWLLSQAIENHDREIRLMVDEETSLVCYEQEVAPGIGLCVCGEQVNGSSFEAEYYFPYLRSTECSTTAECFLERQSDRPGYNGLCDDYRMGLNLIFGLNNFMDIHKYNITHRQNPKVTGVCLSALAIEGKVLFPVEKPVGVEEKTRTDLRLKLLKDARNGDPKAIETLTYADMNINAKINRFIYKSDVYTMVDSFFMPQGVESDHYSMMGTIMNVSETENEITHEKLILMDVETNDIFFKVLVNKEKLMGEPAAGRRFKGDILLQGNALIQ